MRAHEVALLELDRDQDVRRRHHREEQVRDRHRRRAPEREEPADVQRVAHIRYSTGVTNFSPLLRLPAQVAPDLPQPEQVEVVDDERRHEHEQPAEREPRVQERRDADWFSTLHTTPPSGRHCQKSRISARLLAST